MELHELVGKHIFSGIEIGKMARDTYFYTEHHAYVKFTLDGVTYMAEEDPDDGYRSYMNDLVVAEEPCKIKLPNVAVVCRMMQDRNWEKNNVLIFTDAENGKDILAIGTANYDDYYPYCVMEYMPENMSCNEGRDPNG